MHVLFDTLVARVLFSIVGHRTWLRGKIVALFVFGFLKCDPVSVVYLRDLSDATPLFLPSTHLPYLSFGGYRASCKRLATFHRFEDFRQTDLLFAFSRVSRSLYRTTR